MPLRIALVGPRGSGKSVFTLSLEAALRAAGHSAAAHELDIYSCSHPFLRGEITAEERERRKTFVVNWDKARATRAAFLADECDIVLGDMAGGRFADPPYLDRDYMLAVADAAIVVGRHPGAGDGDSTTANWHCLMAEQGIPVIARIHSLLDGQDPFDGFIPARGLDRSLGIQPENPAVTQAVEAVFEFLSGLAESAA